MARARNGEIELEYDTFGSRHDPPLILLHGLGSSLLLWYDEFCEGLVDRGFFVLRMDNRDAGLSSVLADGTEYSLIDMADDVVAVLDDAGVDRAVVFGFSMGGMIAQAAAIAHPNRVAALVSMGSNTGEADVGAPTDEAMASILAPAEDTVEAQVERDLEGYRIWSNPEWRDEVWRREYFERCYRRAWHRDAASRQAEAIFRSPSRAETLTRLDVPTLVIHGSDDPLVQPDGGRRTAELIPGAEYLEIDGMRHVIAPQVWAPIISAVTDLAGRVDWSAAKERLS